MARIFSFIVLVALLLVTGFVYITTRPAPEALRLLSPKGDEKSTGTQKMKSNAVLTVLLADKKYIYYYSGEFNKIAVIEKTDYKGIRPIILDRRKEFGDSLVVIIKTSEKATYTNTVDILDEMSLADIKRYALVDITKQEVDYLKSKE